MSSDSGTPRSNIDGDVPNIKSLLKLKKRYDAPDEATLSESYKKNSEKELLWLWCAHNLVRQLKFEYPHLQATCLSPLNECGVEKLICTFVKPTVLPYSHLYDVDACATFVADFIYYSADRYKEVLKNKVYKSILLPELTMGNCTLPAGFSVSRLETAWR